MFSRIIQGRCKKLMVSELIKNSSSIQQQSFGFASSKICIRSLCASTIDSDKKEVIMKRFDMRFNTDLSEEALRTLSLSTANSKDLLKHKISQHVNKFKIHPSDTGSSAVQSK